MLARAESEMDAGPRRTDRARLCIVTRAVKPLDELIRFVVGPSGDVVPDIKRKLPGRGVWVSADRATLALAVKRKVFSRAFRRDVKVADDLADMVDRLLEWSVLDALGIAQKAGGVICGFARIEGALRTQPVVALIHAADARPDGVRKLAAAARSAGKNAVVEIDFLTPAQLDLALGLRPLPRAPAVPQQGRKRWQRRGIAVSRRDGRRR
jgi:predicted RNA-binding protein YlxR (DUF448 family)